MKCPAVWIEEQVLVRRRPGRRRGHLGNDRRAIRRAWFLTIQGHAVRTCRLARFGRPVFPTHTPIRRSSVMRLLITSLVLVSSVAMLPRPVAAAGPDAP